MSKFFTLWISFDNHSMRHNDTRAAFVCILYEISTWNILTSQVSLHLRTMQQFVNNWTHNIWLRLIKDGKLFCVYMSEAKSGMYLRIFCWKGFQFRFFFEKVLNQLCKRFLNCQSILKPSSLYLPLSHLNKSQNWQKPTVISFKNRFIQFRACATPEVTLVEFYLFIH